MRNPLGTRTGWTASIIAFAVLAAACSSSSSKTSTSAATPSTSTSTASTPAYNGPEASLPTSFADPTASSATAFTIGWLIPNASIPSLQSLTTGITKEATALGGKVITLDSQLNPQLEVSNFNQLLAQNVSGIISFPLNPAGLAPSLAQAKAKGIPVVSIDAPASASDQLIPGYFADILLSRDRGSAAVAALAAKTAPGGEFALLGIAAPIPSLQYVIARDKYWAQQDGMKFAGEIDSQADTGAGASTALSSIIAKYPNVKVVFTYNDVSGVGAAAQARTSGSQVKVIGFNGEDEALQAVAAGRLFATYQVPYVQDGMEGVKAIYNTLTKQHLPLPTMISSPGMAGDKVTMVLAEAEVTPPTAGWTPLLALSDLSKRYGGVRALRAGSLTIGQPGEVHALVGANGSGKSTLLGVLSGQIVEDAGTIRRNGELVVLHGTRSALARGIVMVSQETAVAGTLTVAENVLLGHRQVRGRTGINWRATHAEAARILQRLGVDIDPGALVATLPPDQQQLVEIARALSTRAEIVILDEPTSSLTDDQVASLSAAVRTLSAQGVAVLLVSHRFAELYALCSRVTVLRDGVTVLQAAMATTTQDELIDAMVGSARERPGVLARPAAAAASGAPPALNVRGLSVGRRVSDVDLSVATGEIVGLAGLIGSGRSELLEAIFGARPSESGSVDIDGEVVNRRTPRAMVGLGVGFLPPDRKIQGLVLLQSITANLLMGTDLSRFRLAVPRRRSEAVAANNLARRLRLKFGSLNHSVDTLSGGNQQKVAIGKWIAAGARIMLLDEPTRGVDVAAKAEIHSVLRELAAGGAAILVSSSENDELLGLCDRIIVLSRGRITAQLDASLANEDTLGAAMGGHQ